MLTYNMNLLPNNIIINPLSPFLNFLDVKNLICVEYFINFV